MANTKISELTATTAPTGSEELVYAYNNANGKMTLDTMKIFAGTGKQDTLVSGTNIKTINNTSLLGSGNISISGGTGTASYDAVVDASGNGDYTTIGAAVAAGKYNLFIKNGNYTETSGLDASTGGFLSLIGESRDGVVVTVPSDCNVSGTSYRFINMGNTPKYLYIKNIKFNITFTSVDYFCRSGNVKFDIRIEDCDFVYSNTQTSSTYLFYCTECIDLATGTDSQPIVSKYPWNGIYGCSFYTESSNTNRVIVWYGDGYFKDCKFTTGDSGGEMSFTYLDKLFEGCYFDVYQLDGSDFCFIRCVVKVKDGGLVEQSNTSSDKNHLSISLFSYSSLSIGSLGTQAQYIQVGGLCEYSSFSVASNAAAKVSIGGSTRGNKIRGAYFSYGDLNGTPFEVHNGAMFSKFYDCGNVIVGGSSSRTSYVSYCDNYFETSNVTIGTSEATVSGNTFDGNNGTVELKGSYVTFIGNIHRGLSLSDTGTGNVKANNIA